MAPCSRGFDKSFAFLPGSGNHYNYEPQSEDGRPTPKFVSSDGWWMEDDRHIDRRTELPADFYSTKTFTDRMIDHLENRTEQQREQPFFGFLAYTAPHWPLQAPEATVAKYMGMYDDGPEALRKRRLQGLMDCGLISRDVEPAPMTGPLDMDQEWELKSPQEKAESARKMEVCLNHPDVLLTADTSADLRCNGRRSRQASRQGGVVP